jgi:two-component system, OmpR family, response regulator RegX3
MATARELILIITMDEVFAKSLEKYFSENGYDVPVAHRMEHALALARVRAPALVLVDRRQETLVALRRAQELCLVPFLVVVPPGMACSEDECAEELDTGVDAVICAKSYGELLARVRAILRRERLRMVPHSRYVVGRLEMDVERHEVKVGGSAVMLTQKEFQILRQLMLQPARVFTRDELLNKVWGEENSLEDHTLDVHIHSLRQKIEQDPSQPRYIMTVRGVGYKLAEG